jgi:hypothetical protein
MYLKLWQWSAKCKSILKHRDVRPVQRSRTVHRYLHDQLQYLYCSTVGLINNKYLYSSTRVLVIVKIEYYSSYSTIAS